MPKEKVGTDEKEIKKYLDDIDGEMDDYKETYISKGWDEVPDFYRGRTQWGEFRPSHKLSPILNFMMQSVERKASQMTDTKPFMDILPYYDPLQDVANAIENIIASKWSEHSFDLVLTDIVYYAQWFGTAGTNTIFDNTLQGGKGDITVQCVDPRLFNFDPMVSNTQNLNLAEYVRLEQIMSTSLLKYTFKDKASEIKANAPFKIKKPIDRGLQGRTVRRPVTDKSTTQGAVPRSIVREYWIQDRTMYRGKLKYPGGRHIIIAGDAIVKDEANPYWDERHPIDIIDWHRDPDSAWGIGDIIPLMELQKLLNKLIALIAENGLLMSNGIWVGDANALEPKQWDDLDNVPGLKVKKRPGSSLERVPPPPLSRDVFQLVAYLEKAIEKLSGHTEVVQGKTPGEVKSGVAIEALQSAAMALVRLKSRSLESLMERAGQKLISRIFQFETDDRLMWRLASGEQYKQFKFFRSMLTDKRLFPNPRDAWRDFLFKIRPGSSLAMSNWQKSLVAMQMYQAQPEPLLDRTAVLETMDWPGRTAIEERLEAKKANDLKMMMAAQMMSQGIGSPSGQKGGSAPKVSNINSPHAAQGMQEAMRKGTGGMP